MFQYFHTVYVTVNVKNLEKCICMIPKIRRFYRRVSIIPVFYEYYKQYLVTYSI